MPAPHQVKLINGSTGAEALYATYDDARTASSDYDTIQIWADLDEEILLKDKVDIWIAPGRTLNRSTAGPTITDGGNAVTCNIGGDGNITNTYETMTPVIEYFECVLIANSASKVTIECDEIRGLGKPGATIEGSTISIVDGAKFSLTCEEISSKNNTCILVTSCEDLTIICLKIVSGYDGGSNGGIPVISSAGAYCTMQAQQVICNGYGTCLLHLSGTLNANFLKITTNDSNTNAHPVVLVDNGDDSQILNLSFDEIQNLNDTAGDAVTANEGYINLTGRRIYSYKGLSLNLSQNAYIICKEIISGTKGINILNNTHTSIVIDSEYIEGGIGNTAVIYSSGAVTYTIRNAKIKSSNTSSSSIGIYALNPTESATITLENVIVITGNLTYGESIYYNGFFSAYLTCYGLFLNKTASNVNYLVGDSGNNKVIVDSIIN